MEGDERRREGEKGRNFGDGERGDGGRLPGERSKVKLRVQRRRQTRRKALRLYGWMLGPKDGSRSEKQRASRCSSHRDGLSFRHAEKRDLTLTVDLDWMAQVTGSGLGVWVGTR
ncbi:hypothetical protein V6N12_011036 [Hibiscus sabdariffa]|uniref:Uncharacterized protein n=1 Tax=Hibiscus sabdariffa TaxID=183260 RepID=A0ABR2ELV8_9ROSI